MPDRIPGLGNRVWTNFGGRAPRGRDRRTRRTRCRAARREVTACGYTTRCIRSFEPSVIDRVPRDSAIVPERTSSRMP